MRVATRQAVNQQAQTRLQAKSFPSPVRGWVVDESLAATRQGAAQLLENFFATQTTIKIRGGSPRYATIDETNTNPVLSMMAYIGGSTRKLFATDTDSIFDITTPADEDTAPTASVSGQTSGYYAYVNFATTGGNFMPCVNGTDLLQLYDGTDWYPVSGTDLVKLDYDNETGTFTEGLTVTGGTSGATGVIIKLIDNGTDGSLWLNSVSGTFVDDEAITDTTTGVADADGTTSLLASAITGGDTDVFSHVNAYRNRLFFTEFNTMNIHYLPVDSIGGALGTITLAGTFTKGGAILFTATWSLDSGAGLDDKFVVVSTEGEVAVFEGSNPSDAATWNLVGVYQMPPPLGFKATMRAGGDLIIATEGGMIPISMAVSKDPAALSLSAITKNIEPEWIKEVLARTGIPWEVVKWSTRDLAYISLPVSSPDNLPACYVVNLETGAWSKYTGWDTRCFELHNGQVYFGSNDGRIKRAEIGGFDDVSTPYVAKYIGSWDHLNKMGYTKTIKQARSIWRSANAFTAQLSGSVDYTAQLPSAPNAAADEDVSSLWDEGLWDVALWDVGQDFSSITTYWTSIGKTGFVFAPQIQVTVGGANTPTAELVVFDVTYGPGELVV